MLAVLAKCCLLVSAAYCVHHLKKYLFYYQMCGKFPLHGIEKALSRSSVLFNRFSQFRGLRESELHWFWRHSRCNIMIYVALVIK